MAKSGKGSQFERDLSRQLSLWWSNGEDDSLFWRTQSSGGRATSRRKSGKDTFGQFGDITYTSPKGKRLIRFMMIEAKNGYPKSVPVTTIDKPRANTTQQFEGWINKAYEETTPNGSQFWCLIHKRKGRSPVIYFPVPLWSCLKDSGDLGVNSDSDIFASDTPKVVITYEGWHPIIGMRLSDWLEIVSPRTIKKAVRNDFYGHSLW